MREEKRNSLDIHHDDHLHVLTEQLLQSIMSAESLLIIVLSIMDEDLGLSSSSSSVLTAAVDPG